MTKKSILHRVIGIAACVFIFQNFGCQSAMEFDRAVSLDKKAALRESAIEREVPGARYDFVAGERIGYGVSVQTEAADTVGAPPVDPARTQRLVIYNASMHVVVDRISDSLEQIKKTVNAMGGYMKEQTGTSVTLKVPVAFLDKAIAEVKKLGEVTKEEIKGTDVTEEMRDLNIRLQNAELMRQRLLKLLDKAEKVEDALKIEKELARTTETVELLKGKIAHLKNSVTFSTLTVHFNSPVPQTDITFRTPVAWVHQLAFGLTQSDAGSPYVKTSLFHQPMCEVPKGYLKYYEVNHRLRAMSAKGVMLDLYKEENYQNGELEFWTAHIREVLLKQKVIKIDPPQTIPLNHKSDAAVLTGSKEIGSKKLGYLLALATNKKNVYIFEAWGPIDEFEQDKEKLLQAVKTIRVP